METRRRNLVGVIAALFVLGVIGASSFFSPSPPPSAENAASPTAIDPSTLELEARPPAAKEAAVLRPVSAAEYGAVAGTVMGLVDAAPFEDVQIEVVAANAERFVGTPQRGGFRIEGVPAGPALVRLIADSAVYFRRRSERTREVTVVDGGVASVHFRPLRESDLQVIVVGIDDQVVPGATIELDRRRDEPLEANARGRVSYAARLGDRLRVRGEQVRGEGVVELGDLLAGVLRIRAQLVEAGSGSLDPETGYAFEIEGRVIRLDTEEPVADARIVARRTYRDPPILSRTSEDGRFRIFAKNRGMPYRVEAQHDTLGVAQVTVDPKKRKKVTVVLELEAAGAIEGHVLSSQGAPATMFKVRWGRLRGGALIDWIGNKTVVDAEGLFSVKDLLPGTYSIEVTTDDEAPTRVGGIDVPERGVARVTVQLEEPGSVSGIVLSAESREPIADARVRLEGFGGSASVQTGGDGSFYLKGLAPGRRSVFTRAEGHRDRIISAIDVIAGDTTGPIEILLTPRPTEEDSGLDFVGIGAILESDDGGGLAIRRLIEGGGASESGLAPGDLIMAVDGQSVDTLGFDGSVQQLRGKEGTTVQVTVNRNGSTEIITILRRPIST